MKNLFKNTLRSLGSNKTVMVALTFLVFLTIGIFTLLSSTTKNVTSTYDNISRQSNLHDFTVSEQYSLGNPAYKTYDKVDSKDNTWAGNESLNTEYADINDYMGLSSDDHTVPWPVQDGSGSSYTRTYLLEFDPSLCSSGDAMLSLWNDYKNYDFTTTPTEHSDLIQSLLFPTIQVTSGSALAYRDDPSYTSTWTYQAITEDVVYKADHLAINNKLNSVINQLYSFIQDDDTALQTEYLDTHTDELNYRRYRSIDINQSPDGIYYKNVETSPSDTIDKMYLFNYSGKQVGENIYENNEFAPNGVSYDDMLAALKYQVPMAAGKDWATIDQTAINKFKILDIATLTDENDQAMFDVLANESNWGNAAYITNYTRYYEKQTPVGSESETLFNRQYRITLSWYGTAPSEATLSNWTSAFAVVSPEYLRSHNLSIFNYQKFDKYTDINPNWTGGTPKNKQDLASFFNTLTPGQIDTFLNSVSDSNKIVVGGGMPYIILGSGITGDFIYPIVSISKPNPNPDKECIFFSNSSGYERTRESFQTCPTEKYIVGKVSNGYKATTIVNEINKWSATNMSFPAGTRAAYLYNDTSNYLNAAAFRIAYIPSLIKKINIVDYAMTIFVMLLSLLITTIVISRYISSDRQTIGIMRANGIRKRSIAASLLPFALIPTVIGGVSGYIFGLFLQLPALGLFSSYWMIPTTTVAFSVIPFIVSILLPFIFFSIVTFITAWYIIRINTVELMKSGSEYKVNIVQKWVNKPFKKVGVLSRFRVSVAFNSLTRLFILCLSSTLTASSLMFSFANIGKFRQAENNTFNSRNYSYAVDLYTPTNQGGQYIPTPANDYGDAGLLDVNKDIGNADGQDKSFMPGTYNYVNHTPPDTSKPDTGYADVMADGKHPADYDITKEYYNEFILSSLLPIHNNLLPTQNFEDGAYTDFYHQNLIFPMAPDGGGQYTDLQYLKNKFLDMNCMNFTVGVGSAKTDPWNIAIALMPENQSNLINAKDQAIVNAAGWKLNAKWIHDETPFISPYVNDGTDQPNWALDDWLNNETGDPLQQFNHGYIVPVDKDGKQIATNWSDWTGNFKIDSGAATMVGLSNSFIPSMIAMNSDLDLPNIKNIDFSPQEFPKLNYNDVSAEYHNTTLHNSDGVGIRATDYSYYVSYNSVALHDDDEVYTYLDANVNKKNGSKVRVIGIQNGSEYVKLVNKKGHVINSLLDNDTVNGNPKIIINAYAAHKYHLNVGSTISFNIDNTANRFDGQIKGEDTSVNQTFNVVGINTSAEGEEYFISQDWANVIIGLKSHLDDGGVVIEPHSYYPRQKDAASADTAYVTTALNSLTGGGSYAESQRACYGSTQRESNDYERTVTSDQTQDDLVDLSDRSAFNNDATPYGFNGLFTKSALGGTMIGNRIPLYSPSGLYPGSAKISDDTLDEILSAGANLQIASQMLGLWNGADNENNTDLGNWIYDAWKTHWEKTYQQRAADTTWCTASDHGNLIEQFVLLQQELFGETSYVSMVQNALDRDSTALVFKNLSDTISGIEYTVLSIIILMSLLITLLISLMVIGDNKNLASIMKALGYTDGKNILSFLFIYVPVVLISLAISIPLGMGIIAIFSEIVFNGAGIYLTSTLTITGGCYSILIMLSMFVVSGFVGLYSLKNETLVERMKKL